MIERALALVLRTAKLIAGSLVDASPPYRRLEGIMVAKEATSDGRYYILLQEEMVEVDSLTFGILMVGEALRVRCTRGYRAINIDRLSPP